MDRRYLIDLMENIGRKRLLKSLIFNSSIAVANILVFSPAFIGINIWNFGLETALGASDIFISMCLLVYGNYQFFSLDSDPREKPIHLYVPKTPEEIKQELVGHQKNEKFKEYVVVSINRIVQIEKLDRKIREVLEKAFPPSSTTYLTYLGAIEDVEKKFFENMDNINDCINVYDENEDKFVIAGNEKGVIPDEIVEGSSKVIDEYKSDVRRYIEKNENIILALKKLLLGLIRLKRSENSQAEQDDAIKIIDYWINQLIYYKK